MTIPQKNPWIGAIPIKQSYSKNKITPPKKPHLPQLSSHTGAVTQWQNQTIPFQSTNSSPSLTVLFRLNNNKKRRAHTWACDEFSQKTRLYLKLISSIHIFFLWFASGEETLTFMAPFVDCNSSPGGPIWAANMEGKKKLNMSTLRKYTPKAVYNNKPEIPAYSILLAILLYDHLHHLKFSLLSGSFK